MHLSKYFNYESISNFGSTRPISILFGSKQSQMNFLSFNCIQILIPLPGCLQIESKAIANNGLLQL